MAETVTFRTGRPVDEAHPGRIWVIIRHDWDNGWISLETYHPTLMEAKAALDKLKADGHEHGDSLLIESAEAP